MLWGRSLRGSFFSLRELSFSSIGTVYPHYSWLDNCPILENESSFLEKKLWIQDFLSLRNHFPAAQNYHSRYFLSLHLKNELDQPISLGVFPWSWRFYIPKGFKRTFHLFVKKKLLILSKMCNFLVKKGVHWKKMCVLQLRNRSLFRGRNACSASTRHLNGSCVIRVFEH